MSKYAIAICALLWVFGVVLLCYHLSKAVQFLKKRKARGRRDSDSELDEQYTDIVLIHMMLHGQAYDYYDDGLMLDGEDAWGGVDQRGADLGFEMGEANGDGGAGGDCEAAGWNTGAGDDGGDYGGDGGGDDGGY